MTESKNDQPQNKLLLIIIGLLVIVVLLVLGWRVTKVSILGLELSPPETPTFTPTIALSSNPQPTATAQLENPIIVAGTALFQDNFEQGISKWKVGQGWELRSDDSNNHFLCVHTTNSDYSYISAGSSAWENYALDVRLMLIESSLDGSVNVDVRAITGNNYSDYIYYFSENFANIGMEKGPPFTMKDLAFTKPILAVGNWQLVRFEANGSHLAVLLDNKLLLQAEDTSLNNGAIVLGAGGGKWDVCFDDVNVTALGQ